MKITILGAQGFVGSKLTKYLTKYYTVFPITRNNLNLLNPYEVKDFLIKEKFDVVINAATTMGNNNLLDDTRNNLGLFMNFYDNKHLFGKFINLSSGAEFDRSTDIDHVEEERIFDVLPKDSYDFGQNMKSRISFQTDNFFTIRIFNCFGLGEIKTRIFPRFLSRQNTLEITNDRFFDYFCIQDLCSTVKHCIETQWSIKDVNAVYIEKFKISEVLTRFCRLNNYPYDFKIVSHGDKNYTGNGAKLNSLGIKLIGLDQGLLNYNKGIE